LREESKFFSGKVPPLLLLLASSSLTLPLDVIFTADFEVTLLLPSGEEVVVYSKKRRRQVCS
jgi:hypothetical protein